MHASALHTHISYQCCFKLDQYKILTFPSKFTYLSASIHQNCNKTLTHLKLHILNQAIFKTSKENHREIALAQRVNVCISPVYFSHNKIK